MPNVVRTLTDTEAAYIAGIVDGEGTVSLERHHGAERRRPVVSVANTDYNLLAYLRNSIGAGRITSKRIAKDHHTPSFVFAIYSRQALQLLRQIFPYCERTSEREPSYYFSATCWSRHATADTRRSWRKRVPR